MNFGDTTEQKDRLIIALGYFDSVHLGHAAVLRCAVERALSGGDVPAVLTFDMTKLRPSGKTPLDILTKTDKHAEIERLGVKRYIERDFRDVVSLSGEAFVRDILVSQYQAAGVCCGSNFRFGKDRNSGVAELQKICSDRQLSLYIVPPMLYEGQPISSTRIKQALACGDVESIQDMLGRPYHQTLLVYRDRMLATKLGFPTINQLFPEALVLPRFGVYHTKVMIDGVRYDGISNIGRRPTIAGGDPQTVLETHILEYVGDLYNKIVDVQFLHFIRDEKRFPDLESLRQAVFGDIQRVRDLVQH